MNESRPNLPDAESPLVDSPSPASTDAKQSPAVVVLAAGRGTRMRSQLPKVLHRVVGRPIIAHVLSAIREAGLGPVCLVVGHGKELVQAECGPSVLFADQGEQLGTGHAVAQALPAIQNAGEIVVIYGECPLLRAETLTLLVDQHRASGAAMTIATGEAANPAGLGRIARGESGRIVAIVEENVATAEQKAIREINGGLYCFDATFLRQELSHLPLRPKGEYYLTDLLEVAVQHGLTVASVQADALEISGVNDRIELSIAESALRRRINESLMRSGVTIVDPSTTYVEPGVEVAADTVLLPGTHLAGKTVIGGGCELGPNTQVFASRIGNGCRVWSSVIESSVVEDNVSIGPWSHLRPGTWLESDSHVGNFAEMKNSHVGPGSKVHHFSYLGDAELGRDVNVGAGTITCNFNSETGRKSSTVIENDVSLGSDTLLVAPVRLGAGAMTGAGSVVTRDVPPGMIVAGIPAKPTRPVRPKIEPKAAGAEAEVEPERKVSGGGN